MATITQHIPSFVETGDEPRPRADFGTLDEMRAIPWVERWTKDPHFLRFSLSDQHYLTAEFSPTDSNPGGEHWVVGYISDAADLGLPEWIENEANRVRREAWNAGARSYTYGGREYKV